MRSQFVLSLLLAFAANGAWAGDIQAGKSKAATCAGCHGPQGVSTIPGYPHLAGQKAGYLVASLKGFRNGDRANPVMGPMAKPLSDQDIDDLAAFYSSLDQCK
jgi:cytochrome c553